MNKTDLLYSEFRTKISTYNFNDILENYDKIDQEIANGIDELCYSAIEEMGARRIEGKFMFSDGSFLSIASVFNRIVRCITVYFIPSNGNQLIPTTQHYYLFGTIRTIKIESPVNLNQTITALSESIYKFVDSTYTFLEKIYITKFCEWNQKRKKILLTGIYELIETEIQRSHNAKFKNKVWLSVIELDKKSGNSGDFVFEFNDTFLKEFIKRLKKIRTLEFSPLVLVSNLISKSVNDEQTEKYKEGKYSFQVSLDDLNIRLDTETYIFWLASKVLYTENGITGMGCHTIANHEQFLLSVDHSAINHELALRIIEPIKDQIIEIFRQNVTEYKTSPLSKLTFKYAAKLHSRIIPLGIKVKDVIGDKLIEHALWEHIKNAITAVVG